MSNNVQNLKFTECRLLIDNDHKNVTIDYLKSLNKEQMNRIKNDIYCPYCDHVKLTFVNTMNPYLRTYKNYVHLSDCNKSVRSQIKNIDNEVDPKVIRILKQVLNNGLKIVDYEVSKKSEHKERVQSKYKKRNILEIDDNDIDFYYVVFGRYLYINYVDFYINHRYIRFSKNRAGEHIFSIAIRNEIGFTDYPNDENVPYDFSVYGKITKYKGHFDILLENSKYLYFSASKNKE